MEKAAVPRVGNGRCAFVLILRFRAVLLVPCRAARALPWCGLASLGFGEDRVQLAPGLVEHLGGPLTLVLTNTD
jgi:hypothetical protein